MSGIAVIYNLDGRPIDPGVLDRMGELMAHRGPDGASQWSDGSVGMAYRALHATPESVHERQPLRDESDNLCLVFDGRLDNREELNRELEAKGFRLRDDTDAELILGSYQAWRED